MDELPAETVMEALEETAFVKDQVSLQSPGGIIVTAAMVAAAVALCGAALFFFL